jgi:hypothetical protein
MIASRIKPQDRRLAVVRLNAVVHEIFTISRFSHLVPIFTTIEEVSAAWDAPSATFRRRPQRQCRPGTVAAAAGAFLGHSWIAAGAATRSAVRSKIRDALLRWEVGGLRHRLRT